MSRACQLEKDQKPVNNEANLMGIRPDHVQHHSNQSTHNEKLLLEKAIEQYNTAKSVVTNSLDTSKLGVSDKILLSSLEESLGEVYLKLARMESANVPGRSSGLLTQRSISEKSVQIYSDYMERAIQSIKKAQEYLPESTILLRYCICPYPLC